MTMIVTLKDEAARIVEQQIANGRYPDAESAVVAALMLLEDAAVDWSDLDRQAVKGLIAEADAEGGEIPLDDVARKLDAAIASVRRRCAVTPSGPP